MMISDEIKNQILQIKPLYLPQSFSKFFTWNELENLLNLRPFVNNIRFNVIGNIPYTWENQGWLSDINTYPPSLLQTILSKYHCYFSDASRVNETVNNISGELESIFENSCVDAHIYFTVADHLEGGFGIHWDYAHNLIVQMEGRTRFLLWDYYADFSVTQRSIDSIPVDPVHDVILEPGDAVFVPLRSYHCALSQSKRLSVSFPVSFNEPVPPQDRYWIKL